MLSINISETIWTVINFFLLLFLLKRFLYNPVIRFMDERQARIDAKLRKEQDAREQTAENQERILAEKEKRREEARQILADSAEALEQQHAAALTEVRKKSGETRQKAEEELKARRGKTEALLRNAVPELGAELAKNLLSEG